MWTLANERVSQRSTHRSTYTDAPALDPTTPDAIAGWKAQPRTTRGGQRHYADLAIENALTLRAVFRLALRQSEGLIGSIMKMLEIDLPVPSRRFSMRLLDSPYFGFRAPAQDRRLL